MAQFDRLVLVREQAGERETHNSPPRNDRGEPTGGASSLMGWTLSRQRVPTRALGLADARRESWIFLGYAVFFIAASFLTGLLIRRWPLPLGQSRSFLDDLWYVLFFKIFLLLLVPIGLHHLLGHRLRDLFFGWRPTPGALLRLVAAWLAGAFFNLGWMGEIRAAVAATSTGTAVARIGIGSLIALVIAGLPEELVYRGMLQTRLECAYGRLPAIALTTLVFTAWHLPSRYLLASGLDGHAGSWTSVAIGTGIPAAIGSLVLCWAWDRFRNLPALVAFHWGVDAIPIIADFLGVPPH